MNVLKDYRDCYECLSTQFEEAGGGEFYAEDTENSQTGRRINRYAAWIGCLHHAACVVPLRSCVRCNFTIGKDTTKKNRGTARSRPSVFLLANCINVY